MHLKETQMKRRYKILKHRGFQGAIFMCTPFDDEPQISEEEIFRKAVNFLEVEEGMTRRNPIFNRDGWYFDRKLKESWVEWRGTAWEQEVDSFLWEWRQQNTPFLENDQLRALETLYLYGNIPRNLLYPIYELAHRHRHNRTLRRIKNSAKVFRKKKGY